MKKLTVYVAAALLPTIVLATNPNAKEGPRSTMPIKKVFVQPAETAPDTSINLASTTGKLLNSSTSSAKEIKAAAKEFKQFNRLTQNFATDFKGASNVHWTKGKTRYAGQFTKDGLQHMVWYSKGGRLTTSMVTYGEDMLPEDVRLIVEDSYSNFNISSVNEIRQYDILVYLITLENAKHIKIVRVCDGELDVYREFRKG